MLGRSGNLRRQLLLAVAFRLLLNEKTVRGMPCTIKSNPKNPAQGIHANQPVTLECDATGTNVDRFSWSNGNGRPIKENVSTTNTSSTLSLKVKNKLDRKFVCTVETGRKNESCSYTLRVNVFGPPVIEDFNPNFYHTFEKWQIEHKCQLTAGWPEPTLEWRVNGIAPDKVVPPFSVAKRSGGLQLTRDATTHKLNRAKEEYVCNCTAKNKYGTDSQVVRYDIYRSAPPVLPKVVTPSRRVFAYEGGNVTLVCEEWALCRKGHILKSITWFHDGKETKDPIIMHKVEDECSATDKNIVRLRRTNLTFQDQGEYSCTFAGEYGDDTKTIQLVIFCKGTISLAHWQKYRTRWPPRMRTDAREQTVLPLNQQGKVPCMTMILAVGLPILIVASAACAVYRGITRRRRQGLRAEVADHPVSEEHTYEDISERAPNHLGNPYMNVNVDGSLNLPRNLQGVSTDFERHYENLGYERVEHSQPRPRSISGAVDEHGRPIYDVLSRPVFMSSLMENNMTLQEQPLHSQ